MYFAPASSVIENACIIGQVTKPVVGLARLEMTTLREVGA